MDVGNEVSEHAFPRIYAHIERKFKFIRNVLEASKDWQHQKFH